jgi:twitching motility protein PilT
MAKIDQILEKASEIKASDVHIAVDNPPMFRNSGELKKFKAESLSSNVTKVLICEILTPEMQKKFEKDLQLEFCYEIERKNRSACR